MIRQLLLCCLLIAAYHSSLAQGISNLNPKVRILGGEVFYIHNVLEGQTLEAIADAYVSTPKAILRNNPGVAEITSGMKLRVPYTDASAAVMSKYDLKLDDALSQEVYAEEPTLPEPEKQAVQPMEEAAALIEVQEEEPLDEEEQEALANINALSTELRSSLSSLKSAGEKVKAKPVMDKDGLPKRERSKDLPDNTSIEPKGMMLAEYLEAQVQPMIDGRHPGGADFLLKEYFLVRINTDGVITNVRDERTEMNGNTFVLKPDSLKGFQLIDDPAELDNQFQSIGLVAEVWRDTFPVKFKNNRTKFMLDGVSEDDGKLIAAYQQEKQLWGKYDVVIAEAKYYLATYEQVEFNPFGEIRNKIYFNSEKRVVKVTLK